jgi:hypothetical protein
MLSEPLIDEVKSCTARLKVPQREVNTSKPIGCSELCEVPSAWVCHEAAEGLLRAVEAPKEQMEMGNIAFHCCCGLQMSASI